jgi:bifunctional DNA-binding transcriptional regulator/antitoxin component of YhaV-PrlF toxin-antitoxin module
MPDRTLGYTRVQPSFRVTLTTEVRKKLRVKVGEMIAYVENGDGNIILKKAELKTIG